MNEDVLPGQSFPLGATVRSDGVNFCVFSENCTAMELLLFDAAYHQQPSRSILLDPKQNKTFYYWHVFVPGVKAGQVYAYRAHGPNQPREGHRFDGQKVLLDPYARSVVGTGNLARDAARQPGDNIASALKGVVVDPRDYDWNEDAPLRRSFADSVIYEMHLRGFTRHPSSKVSADKRGTYAGLIEKIPYLQSLGVTAVELLPITQFDEHAVLPPLVNYWGYDPIAFFAPHRAYSSNQTPLGPLDEFCDMVKALHKSGIEVILDVVYNHTAEGDHSGPTYSFRGLENRVYYILGPDRTYYANYTGCGNTVSGNDSIVRRAILDCLRFWVQVCHVDGFRFDLASVLARDVMGHPLENPPVLWEIESDPVLAGTKIIAEAWDAAGLYQVGTFIGRRWAEWNGQYRDDVRRFIKGDSGLVCKFASRLVGSPDIYTQPNREPHRSINFITCHDGFTLNDLVSYDHKHNEANRQNNGDGADANFGWNHGVEGPTNDPAIESLRVRQIKNFLTTLFISQGTPMLLMGDEARRTQGGNNNAYCHDSETNWLNWTEIEQRSDLIHFVRSLIRFRREHSLFQIDRFWGEPASGVELFWHGVQPGLPDWGDGSHSLAFSISSAKFGEHLYVAFNAYWEPLTFVFPAPTLGERWMRVVDTSHPSPDDFCQTDDPLSSSGSYLVGPRSAIIFESRRRT